MIIQMNFGQRMRKWIKYSVQTTSMSKLVNGSPSKPFKLQKGLRQGDTLSSLFTLVSEGLIYIIKTAKNIGTIEGLQVGKEKVEITHLQYVDDTLFFVPHKSNVFLNYKMTTTIL